MTGPIGFIGQGWIGKNYADDFEQRGYTVTRYALEEPHVGNKEKIALCDIVFIAVPTPTSEQGFDDSIVRSVLSLVGKGKIAVIKSTLYPKTTNALQQAFPDILVLHSPEFLREANAAYDAAHPMRNLIGIPEDTDAYHRAAESVLAILPEAPYSIVLSAKAAELVKYAGNAFLTMKVVYANLLYDLSESLGIDYSDVREALSSDTRIGASHLSPLDKSGHGGEVGRGAGGHCFIKDFEGIRQLYQEVVGDPEGGALLAAFVQKNNALLKASKKDLDLLKAVYSKI